MDQGMGHPRQIRLLPGEWLFVNGAILSSEQFATLSILEADSVLREGEILHANDVTSPLRKLYFAIQVAQFDVCDDAAKFSMERTFQEISTIYEGTAIGDGLDQVRDLLDAVKYPDALARIAAMFGLEDGVLSDDNLVRFKART